MKYIARLLKGIMIGIANILPGISGGMLAISMGVYDTIIHAVTHLIKEPKESIRTLFPYALGAAAGIVCLSLVFEYFFDQFPFQTKMAFLGLIGGGLPALFGRVGKESRNGKSCLFIGVAACFTVAAITVFGKLFPASGGHTAQTVRDGAAVLTDGGLWELRMVLIGVLAAGTMVIPGVSGSMIMMMIGVYEPILQTTNAVIRAAARMDPAALLYYGTVLVPYYIGMAAGVFLFAVLMEHLLARYERQMYSMIIGLVLSSPVVILWDVPWKNLAVYELLAGVSLCLFGYVLASKLGGEG